METVDIYKVCATFRDLKQKGFFAEDHKTGESVMTSDAELMAFQLRGKKDRLNYKGWRRDFQTYLDGYFGRPLIPCDAYLLRRLYKREISELEKEIEKAEAEFPVDIY